MRLVRFGAKGVEKPGLVGHDGRVRDLSRHIPDLSPHTLEAASLDRLRQLDTNQLPVVDADVRLGPCVAGVGKIVCIGLNYSDHAAESGMAVPSEPVIFFKATTAISGPYDDVVLPRGSQKSDWEVELGVVIGARASYVQEHEAMAYVAGFCIVNDLSERAYQLERGGQWVKGKSCDTFAPLGPWLVTRDEIADPQALKMTLDVNGRRRQDGSTATMVFKVPFLVSYLSSFMTLEPGDIISTGTPAGVGMGLKPPVYLKEGDAMELEIEGLGRQRQRVVSLGR
jgi:2-keto-4-pentenoate hydratase/2-oxohepta-3-ene-1,7-dioic acid hydratase in catechol pathway